MAYDLKVTIKDENVKCKQITFGTTDETLVRAAMMKLGFHEGSFTIMQVPHDKTAKH